MGMRMAHDNGFPHIIKSMKVCAYTFEPNGMNQCTLSNSYLTINSNASMIVLHASFDLILFTFLYFRYLTLQHDSHCALTFF